MSHKILGSFLGILCAFEFSCMLACCQGAQQFVSTGTLIFFQSFLSWMFILPFIYIKGISSLQTSHLGLLIIRSLFGLASLLCLCLALQTENLTVVTLLNNAFPLFVPLIAFFWLKEKIKHRAWIGLLIGFIGVAIILQPQATSLTTGLIFGLSSAVFSALLAIALSKLSKEPFHRILFYYFLIFWIFTAPVYGFSFEIPPFFAWIYIFLAAVFTVAIQFTLTLALRKTSAQAVAPLMYLSVVFSAIINFIKNETLPTLSTLIGICMIVAGGLITSWIHNKDPRTSL